MSNLPYLNMCIKESLRMNPPVPFTGRKVTEPLILEGVELQPGTLLEVNYMGMHHNENVWGKDHWVSY